MRELSEETEVLLERMTKQLAEVSGTPFVAHDIVMKFRQSLMRDEN